MVAKKETMYKEIKYVEVMYAEKIYRKKFMREMWVGCCVWINELEGKYAGQCLHGKLRILILI